MSAAVHASCDQASAQAATCLRPAASNLVLATCILASSLAFVDGSVVNVGLPAIAASLAADASALQWVVNAYLLPLSALILLGGAMGDRLGRKRLLIGGTVLFALASIGCAAAPSLGDLLVARLVQGVGAAMLMPNSLAILGANFEGEAKGRAIGLWAATGAAMGAVGPVLGGWLIDVSGWRAVFLINVPIAAAAIVLAWRFVPADEKSEGAGLDWAGGLTVTAALGALTYGLTLGSGNAGWTLPAVASLMAGLALLILFVLIEKWRGERAMVPLSLFGSSNFVGLSLLTLFLYGALGALFVLVPYLLIESAGYSAAGAGAGLLPLPILLAAISPIMGGVAARTGARLPLTIGPLIVAGGFLLMLRIGIETDYWTELLPALLAIALGMSGAVAPLTTAVLSSVDRSHTGAASGFNSAIARTGGLIATALLGSVLGGQGADLLSGFHVAMIACALCCLAAGVAAFMLFREDRPRPANSPPAPGQAPRDHPA